MSDTISQQAAELDDADVWLQQLVTKVATTATNADVDATTTTTTNADVAATTTTTTSIQTPPEPSGTNDAQPSHNDDHDDNVAMTVKSTNLNDNTSSSSAAMDTTINDTIQTMNAIGTALYEMEYDHLTCYCCGNIYHAPVTIEQCRHIFCSYCIRTKFYYTLTHSTTNRQPSCPICKCTGSSTTDSSSSSRSTVVNRYSFTATGTSKPRGGVSSSSSSLTLLPNRALDVFVHVFRSIRQPLLKVLKKQQVKLMQQQQLLLQLSAKRTKEIMDDSITCYQHLPRLLLSIQRATKHLQRVRQEQPPVKTSAPVIVPATPAKIHEIEETVKYYISSIVDRCHSTRQVIEYPTSLPTPVLPGERSTLTKVILNGKTSKKQYVELLTQQCGFTNITGMVTLKQYYKTDAEMIGGLRKMYIDYIALHNSENDTLYPRSSTTLVALIEQQQSNIFQENTKLSTITTQQQHLTAPGTYMAATNVTTATATTTTTTTSGIVNYDKCIQILKQQRKLLGESPSSSSTKSRYWSTITTGNRTFDAELAGNYQQLIQVYYERFPKQKEKHDALVQQYRQQQQSQPTGSINYKIINDPSTNYDQKNINTSQQHNNVPKQNAVKQKSTGTRTIQRPPSFPPTANTNDDDDDTQSPTPTLASAFTTTSSFNSPRRSRIQQHQQQSVSLLQQSMKQLHNDNKYCTSASSSSLNTAIDHGKYRSKRPFPVCSTVSNSNPSTLIKFAKTTKDPTSQNHHHYPTGGTIGSSNNTATKKSPPAVVVIDSNSLIGPWICAHCTFYNTTDRSTRARCEICSNLRGTSSSGSSRKSSNSGVALNTNNNDQPKTATKTVAPPKSSQSSTGSSSIIEIDC